MQTIKTAVVVVLLLFVLYGGYVALYGPDTQLREDLTGLVPLDQDSADVAGPGPILSPPSMNNAAATPGSDPFEKFVSRTPPNFSNSATSGASSPSNNSSPFPPSFGNGPNSNVTPLPALAPPALVNSSNPNSFNPGAAPDLNVPALPKLPPSDLSVPDLNSMDDLSVDASAPASGTATLPKMDLPQLDLPNTANLVSTNNSDADLQSESTGSVPAIPPSKPGKSFDNAKQLAMEQINSGNLKDALATLSVFYNAPELTSTQRADLVDLLDALSREVVYSRRHLMDVAYVVVPGETLEQVAKRCNVPTEVIARINAFEVNSTPPAGTKLKVVPGPFRAEVDLTRNELTMFVNDLYAGHYPVTFGNEPSPKPGTYEVMDKQKNRNYYSNNGMQIPANDDRNPYGGYWIDLGQDVCIHGSPTAEIGQSTAGCISLSPLDASDVFGMLGRGSQVTIRR